MNNKVSLIKITKKVSTKIELAKAILNVTLCFNNLKLSHTEITVMSYFMVYGINQQTKSLLIKAEVCKNINNIKTIMVKLKKLGLVYKDEFSGKVLINSTLNFELTPTVGIYLKIDNYA